MRYAIPNFPGQENVENLLWKIDQVLFAYPFLVVNVRVNKAAGCTTFALRYDSTENFLKISNDLSKIHPRCVAISYKTTKQIIDFQNAQLLKEVYGN